jgi:hypothetical protein
MRLIVRAMVARAYLWRATTRQYGGIKENTMDEYGHTGEGSMAIAVDTSVNTLLNDAHAWLRYAGGVTGLLVESLEDDDVLHRQRMMLALGAVGTLVSMGVQCVAHAQKKMEWDKL